MFLGTIILGYLTYTKVHLGAFLWDFFEYHHFVEDDDRENCLGPVTIITAGLGKLWELEFREYGY